MSWGHGAGEGVGRRLRWVDSAVRKVRENAVWINRFELLQDFCCCCFTSGECRASNRWFWKKTALMTPKPSSRWVCSNRVRSSHERGRRGERMMNEGFHHEGIILRFDGRDGTQ